MNMKTKYWWYLGIAAALYFLLGKAGKLPTQLWYVAPQAKGDLPGAVKGT